MTPEQIIAAGEGLYSHPRLLPTGEWACLSKFLFTTGLLVGVDKFSYRTRFCYASAEDARAAIETWDGSGDPPGPWIKEKGGVERCNPKFAGIPIVVDSGQSAQ